MRPAPRLLAAAALILAAGVSQAAVVQRVEVVGLDAAMTDNVYRSLTLVDSIGKDVSGRRMAYLVRTAETEAREALEPFGYYSPTVDVARDRDSGVVTVTIAPGAPVRVGKLDVAVEGEGHDDDKLQSQVDAFLPKPGGVFDSVLYDTSKAAVVARLAQRGYFDATLAAHRVEVTRASNNADVDLRWDSGARYALGTVAFEQTPQVIRPQLLQKLVTWDAGDPFEAIDLDRLRTSLTSLDYFGTIAIDAQPQAAGGEKIVPVTVHLTPAKRSIYTAGLSFGTESGGGVRLGVERRYLNSRGHKALAQVDWAQERKTLTLQYRVPAFAWLDGWYTASLQFADEQTDFMDSRRAEFVASRSGQVNTHLTAIASLHVLRERWAFTGDLDNPGYRYGSFSFPELSAEYVDVDDRLYPRRGLGGSVRLRAAPAILGSDTSFVQAYARASWFHGLGPDDRLIVRGELGHTFTGELTQLPPSLRFYAGGDRSIRGYDYHEVGPRIGDFGIGARNLVTTSTEYEHYFNTTWGGAVFVDGGSAFNGRHPDWHTGVGVGVRWRSPVGPVRVDIAHGLDDPQSVFTLNLSFGADL
jgi:translocation and assembly module TamA